MKRQRDNSDTNAVAVKKKKDDDEDVEHHHRLINLHHWDKMATKLYLSFLEIDSYVQLIATCKSLYENVPNNITVMLYWKYSISQAQCFSKFIRAHKLIGLKYFEVVTDYVPLQDLQTLLKNTQSIDNFVMHDSFSGPYVTLRERSLTIVKPDFKFRTLPTLEEAWKSKRSKIIEMIGDHAKKLRNITVENKEVLLRGLGFCSSCKILMWKCTELRSLTLNNLHLDYRRFVEMVNRNPFLESLDIKSSEFYFKEWWSLSRKERRFLIYDNLLEVLKSSCKNFNRFVNIYGEIWRRDYGTNEFKSYK